MPYLSLSAAKAMEQFERNRSSLEVLTPDVAKYYDDCARIVREATGWRSVFSTVIE